MIGKRASMVALGATVLATTLVACGTDAVGNKGQITLKIWDYSAEQVEFHKKVSEQFTKEHPGIKLEWRSIAQDEYKKTLPLAFQSKQAPDIFYWSDNPPNTMAQLLSQQWIKPLHPSGKVPDDFTKRWPDGSFVEGINVSEGKAYAFPFSENLYWGPGYMFLHNDLFKQAGLDTANPPKTWSELKAACAKIKAATKAECIASPSKGRELQRLWYALAAGARTDLFFDYKNGKFSLDDPKLLETFAFIQDLQMAGYIAPGTNDKNFSRQQFAAGQAAIYFDGTWAPSVLNTLGLPSGKLTVAPHPHPDGGTTGALARQFDGNKYWVGSQTTHHEAAWTFLEWMTKPDGYFVQEYFKGGFGTLAFADNKKYVSDPAVKQILKIAEQPGFRVTVPVPVLKCSDLSKSKAYLEAISKRPDWEFESMVEALVGGKPLGPSATALVTERNTILDAKLKEEAAAGLKVSKDCYTFPDWQYTADYGLDKYSQ
ncbi:extracellular solute-binding protein [Nonomuraea jabiensis]|uniref:ABC transporter substrate-binding protein n=1 Tax=Nonomuraea jabiensis TaxID=882448 RepID=UPI0034444222